MADKHPDELRLAAEVHRTAHDYGNALGAPASADRIDRITAAERAHMQALADHDHLISGRATSVPLKR
jgi:hypothetical protein